MSPGNAQAQPCAEMLWRNLIQLGNAHFEGARYPRALHVYQDALSLAHAYLGQWQSEDDGFTAVVVSALNLCATQVELGEIQGAAEQLCSVHQWLLHTGRNDSLQTHIRRCALRHLSHTFVFLRDFQQRHGDVGEIGALMAESCVCQAWKECNAEFISLESRTLH